MDHDEDQPMNNTNTNSNDNPASDAGDDHLGFTTHTESFVFTGTAPAFLATMQNLVNRIIMREQQPAQPATVSDPPSSQSTDEDVDMLPRNDAVNTDDARATTGAASESQNDATAPTSTATTTSPSTSSGHAATVDSLPATADAVPDARPATSQNIDSLPIPPSTNPSERPIRPLPRPHSHVHAHTPFGVIDLFAFNVNMTVGGEPAPSQPQSQSQPEMHPHPHPLPHPHPQTQLPRSHQIPQTPLTATFTFNMGPESFAGFEAMFLNHLQKEREPDMERAKTLLRGMEVISEGLVRRLERAGGVPGGQGSEDQSSGCAVCWGPLLEAVEPGEWDSAVQKEEKEKQAADNNSKGQPQEEDEFRGRIVALPCAHVYHAECLLPWFSRNTTCPTCRFDIDPESLTWNPQPPPAPPETEPPEDMPMPPMPDGRPFPFMQDEGHRMNAAEAERLNSFFTTLLGGFVADNGGQPQQQQPEHRPDENHRQVSEAQTQTQAEAIPSQPSDAPSASLPSSTSPLDELVLDDLPFPPEPIATGSSAPPPNLPQTFGPAPPPLPPPRLRDLPTIFRLPPMPLFLFPNRPFGPAGAPPQGQTHIQPLHQPHPQPQPQPAVPEPDQEPTEQLSEREVTQTQSTEAPTPIPSTAPAPAPAQQSQPARPQQQQQQQPRLPMSFNIPHFYPGFSTLPGAGAPNGARPTQPPPPPPPHLPNANANANINAGTNIPNNTNPNPTATGHFFTHIPPPYAFPPFGFGGGRMPRSHAAPRERRQWVPPEPVGRTLRQRVEAKEQELGLRCDDVVCFFAPTDEDPLPSELMSERSRDTMKRRVQLHGAYDSKKRSCEHKFHPACLVSQARVNGRSDEEVEARMEMLADGAGVDEDGENGEADRPEIELSCPVCRADGTLACTEWQEGVRSLQESH